MLIFVRKIFDGFPGKESIIVNVRVHVCCGQEFGLVGRQVPRGWQLTGEIV
jgi:hypothetical protein